MNILITGGLGVIGSWVTRWLVENGHRPVVYENRVDTMLVPDIAGKLEIVQGDILDMPTLIRTLREYKIQRLCHLAGRLGEATQANPWYGFQINALGTLNVLEAARVENVERVVYTSSIAVFAPFTGEHLHPTYRPVNEDYPKGSLSTRHGVYGTAKLASELLGFQYQQKYGVEFIALRYSPLYGIGRLTRHGGVGVYSKIIENAMLNKPTAIPRGGDQKTDLVYVKDAAHAIILSCFAPDIKYRAFNIASGEGHRLQEIADSVKKIYPDAVISIGEGLDPVGSGHGYCVFDISRANKELGYSPQYTIEAGVRDYVETMRELNIPPTYTP